jgi:hypothetical protein
MLHRCALLIIALAVAPSLAAADGAFAKSNAAVHRKLSEPNQKAFLTWDGGRETLILQVKYAGGVEDFGWIVPVPSRPEMKAGTTRLFFELANLTLPLPASSSKMEKGHAGGARGGVSVVERAQVGPYDATVLSASDPDSLATWLRKHNYVLPPGAGPVLKSYVDRGWYYVALRIRVKKDLLGKLRRIAPGVPSLDQAPERLADRVICISDTQPAACADKLQALDRAVRWATADPSDPYGTARGGELSRSYRRYRTMQRDLRESQIPDREITEFLGCLPRCAGGPDSPAFRAAAKRAGWPSESSAEELARAFYASVQQDLLRNVPYAKSHVGRFHAALRAASQGPKEMFWYFQEAYQTTRRSLPEVQHMRGPAKEVDRLEAQLHRHVYISNPVGSVVRVLDTKIEVYREVQRFVVLARDQVQQDLAGGTITPLRLEFASRELIYPLRISSLNPGSTDINLYVLAGHRMEAPGFRTDFADAIGSISGAPRYQELSRFLTPARTYLTEFRATMTSADMKRDVTISQAATDESHRAAGFGGAVVLARDGEEITL